MQAQNQGNVGGKSTKSGDVAKEIMATTKAAGAFLAKKGKKIDEQYHVVAKAKEGYKVAKKQVITLDKKHHIYDKSRDALNSFQAACTTERYPEGYQAPGQPQSRDALNETCRTGTVQLSKPDREKVAHLVGMGFSRNDAGEALARRNNDLDLAINYLLGA